MSTLHEDKGEFFSYINAGSLAAAAVICPYLLDWFEPNSLLDVGCGAGAWCRVWKEQGVVEVLGVDGDYVGNETLLIPEASFIRKDLSQPFDLDRRFDLVTSLEVAEHVAPHSAETFVDNLTRHGDKILFSAAVPGQGGEYHVNEQPLSFWRAKFEARGYRCFDPLRRRILGERQVEAMYRYNTLLYVNDSVADQLPNQVKPHLIARGEPLPEVAPLAWRARNAVLRVLPGPAVEVLAQAKHTWFRMRR